MRSLRTRVALLALVAFVPSFASADKLHDRILQHQARAHAAHMRLQAKKGQLSTAKGHSQALHSELLATFGNIARVDRELAVLAGEVRWNERRLAWNKRQLDAAQNSLDLHDRALRRRLVDAYEHGNLGYINVLLASASFTDFVERWEDIRLLIASNEHVVRERRAAERRVAGARATLETQQVALQSATDRQAQARAQLAALAAEKRNLVAVADVQEHHVATQVAQLEEISAQEEAQVTALIRERQQEEEARRAAQRRAALLSGHELPPGFDQAPRALAWPASGPISSPFGFRPDPFTGAIHHHDGIDIAAAMGATVTAAAAGRIIVVQLGYGGGYGNHIVIDHGGGIATLYGHLSQVFVAEGQEVQQGQAIGAVGSTGESTGPHLHFEVRLNGTPVDPLGWLR